VATQSGTPTTTDAYIAATLCRDLNLDLDTVHFDDAFQQILPELTVESSYRSGGLTSLTQAHEVYFYQQLQLGGAAARLSGNGGNQVGRLCLEGVSVRGADIAVLSPPLPPHASAVRSWVFDEIAPTPDSFFEALIWKELHWPLAANMDIGTSFCQQILPYLDPLVLRQASTNPAIGTYSPRFGYRSARLRDLRHRTLGLPYASSWQQQLLVDFGGPIADTPLNLGWTPGTKGISSGAIRALASVLDLYATRDRPLAGVSRRLARAIGHPGGVEPTPYREWARSRLRDFCYDLVHSQSVRDSALFDNERVERILHQYFYAGHKGIFSTVVSVLDLALAHSLFVARSLRVRPSSYKAPSDRNRSLMSP
jgi:hypothetical protein